MRLCAAGVLVLSCSVAGGGIDEPVPIAPEPAPDAAANSPMAPDVPSPAPSTPGAPAGRLRELSWVTSDGARQPTGTWRDSARSDAECAFGVAADGSVRCLPLAPGLFVGYHRDSGCTERLFVSTRGCAAPVGGELVAGTCPARARRFELQPLAARPTTVWTRSGAQCLETPAPSDLDYFTVVREIAPADLAEATIEAD